MQFIINFEEFTEEQERRIQHDVLLMLKDEVKGHLEPLIDDALDIEFQASEHTNPVEVTFRKILFEDE